VNSELIAMNSAEPEDVAAMNKVVKTNMTPPGESEENRSETGTVIKKLNKFSLRI
jgi:hypothetical protein